ncbi:MAG: hypothetical protein H8D46_03800 [FCB group bacterium]|nr:hypothetical protein [FCB group bacterium]
MDYTYKDLHGKTVAQLRKICEDMGNKAPHGFLTLHKEHLLPKLCEALGIEDHEHHEFVGINKKKVKIKIRALRAKRDEINASTKDKAELKRIRREIHDLKRKMRKAMV